ncbi:hypothetical protein J4207_06420 [Candidatus Woesearchaeota archaeon]|nr:hypothetical protein [Candidatus Woesearchaeota archaeon]
MDTYGKKNNIFILIMAGMALVISWLAGKYGTTTYHNIFGWVGVIVLSLIIFIVMKYYKQW